MYVYYQHEGMPFWIKVKLENVIKTIQRAEAKKKQWWKLVVPGYYSYLCIEKDNEYYVSATDVNPLVNKPDTEKIIRKFSNLNEVIQYLSEIAL